MCQFGAKPCLGLLRQVLRLWSEPKDSGASVLVQLKRRLGIEPIEGLYEVIEPVGSCHSVYALQTAPQPIDLSLSEQRDSNDGFPGHGVTCDRRDFINVEAGSGSYYATDCGARAVRGDSCEVAETSP